MSQPAPFVGGYRDQYGIPRSIPLPQCKDHQVAEKYLEELLNSAKPEADPKAKPLFWDDTRVKEDSPINWDWRRTTTLGRIVSFFEHIIRLLTFFWPRRSRFVDQRLFASLCANRIYSSLKGLRTPPLSKVLKHTVQFLEKEKGKTAPPKRLLERFKQCARWAEKVEYIQKLDARTKRVKELEALGKRVNRAIKKLKKGDSCLMPGGWESNRAKHNMIYEIKRTGEQEYQLRLVSRDSHANPCAELASAGKTKIHPVTTFEKLTLAEVSEPAWLMAMLSLQIPPHPTKDRNPKEADRSSICNLLKPFQNRQVPPSKAVEQYRTPTLRSSQAKNVWTLVDLVANPRLRKTREGLRRKLRLKVSMLFEFFKHTVDDLRKNKTNQILLLRGIRNVGRLASVMYGKGYINRAEAKKLHEELKVIRKYVDQAQHPDREFTKGSPFDDPVPKPYDFLDPKLSLQRFTPPKSKGPFKFETKGSVSPRPSRTLSQNVETFTTPELKPKNVVDNLKKLREACEEIDKTGNAVLVQDQVMRVLGALPFDAMIREKKDGKKVSTLNPKGFWGGITEKERIACSCEIGKLSQLLSEAMEKTDGYLPDRLYALTKATLIQDHLARLNVSLTKYDDRFFYHAIPQSVRWIFQGRGHFLIPHMGSPINPTVKYNKNVSRYLAYWSREEFVLERRETGFEGFRRQFFGKIKQEFSQDKVPEQLLHLEKQYNFLSKIPSLTINQKVPSILQMLFNPSYRPIFTNYSQKKKLRESWVQNYAYRSIQGTAKHGNVQGGGYSDPKRRHYFEETQEAITDNPQKVARRREYSEGQEKGVPKELSKEDLRDLIYNTRKGISLFLILGYITKKRHLLEISDVRHFLEHRVLTNVSKELKRYPQLPDMMAKWAAEEIDILKNRGQVLSSLFLIDLARKMRRAVAYHQKDHPAIKKFPDNRKDVLEWAEKSMGPKHAFHAYRHQLWQQVLLYYEDNQALDSDDLVLLGRAISIYKTTSCDLLEYDPLSHDRVELLLGRLQPLLENMLKKSPKLSQHVMDRICQQQGCQLPKEKWSGTFPVFRAGPYYLDFIKGIFGNAKDGTLKTSLPPTLIKGEVAEALPGEKLHQIPMTTRIEKKETIYEFKDKAAVPCYIVNSEKGARIYKEFTVKGKKVVGQYLPKGQLFPSAFSQTGQKSDYSFLGKIQLLLRSVRSLLSMRVPAVPSFLLNPEYRFWVDPKQPQQIFLLGKGGKPYWQLFFKESWGTRILEKVIDLRPGALEGELTVHPLGKKRHVTWDKLTRIEDPGNIMVWRKAKKILRVELPRFDLTFEERDGKPVCLDPRFEKWTIDTQSDSLLEAKGIPHGLVLRHPETGQRRLLVPNQKVQEPEERLKLPNILKIYKHKILGRLITGKDKDPAGHRWEVNRSEGHFDLYTFEIDNDTHELHAMESKTADEAYLHLATVSMLSGFETGEVPHSVTFLRQAEQAAAGKLSKGAMERLQTLSNYKGETPDEVAIRLHAAQLGRKKAKLQQRGTFAERELELFKKYIRAGGAVDLALRIERNDELELITRLSQREPEFVKRHRPLLFGVPKGRAIQASFKQRTFFQKSGRLKGKLSDYPGQLYNALRSRYRGYKVPVNTNPLFSKSLSVLAGNFLDLYQIIKHRDLKSQEFKKVHQTLMALPSPKGIGENGSFYDVLQRYLITVLEVRRGGKVTLPDASKIDPKKFTWERDLKDPNRLSLGAFLKELDQIVEQVPFQVQDDKEFESTVSPEDTVAINRALVDLDRTVDLLQKTYPTVKFDTKSLEELDVMVQQLDHDLPKVQLKHDGQDALFQAKDLKSFFTTTSVGTGSQQLDLTSLIQNAKEPVVVKAAEELKDDLEYAKQQRVQHPDRELKKDHRLSLAKKLQERRAAADKQVSALKAEVEKCLALNGDELHHLQLQGKLSKKVGWTEAIKHYLQQDLKVIIPYLPKGVNAAQLNDKMFQYLLKATERQRLDRAMEMLNKMDPKQEGITTVASEELYRQLTVTRQFDSAAKPHFLIFEYLSGITLRQQQVQMIQDFLDDPSCIRQAITGAGKTSVILILTALMKAHGNNLVAIQFPRHLYEENMVHLKSKLGNIFNREVYPLRYSIRDKADYKVIYEDLLRTVVKKGVVATTMESLQALEIKWIRLLDQMAIARKNKLNLSETDKVDYRYLSKILRLMRKRMDCLIDEFDKTLTPREERHLRIGETTVIPKFMWETSLYLYDKLLQKEDKLGLKKNIQAELTTEKSQEILREVMGEVAQDWIDKKKIPDQEKQPFKMECVAYLEGKSEAFLDRVDSWSKSEKDRLVLMKDQFTTFLPLSLSRTCEVNYIRSEDGIHTKPALTSDIPKEHSEYEQDLERVNYTIQDYYQTGIRKFVLENWVKRLKHEAEEEREINKEYGSDQDKIRSIDETKAGELFKDYFPNHSLSTPLEVQIDSLVKALNEDMTCLRRYLSRELAKIDSSNARITCDAHNLVSMAKSTSGASATLSGIHGLHQKILGITPDKRKASIMHAREKGTVGEMTLRVIDKSAKAPSFLRYDPACPEDLLNDVFKVDPNFQSIVDGAAAFHGLKKEKFVKQLLNKQKNIKGIVHFGEDGKKKVMTSEGVRVLLQSELKPTELGMWLSEKGSRGADVRLGPQNRALITANPRQRLPEVLQTAGRLRIRSQQLRYVAPKGSSISTPQDLLKVSLENEALIEADNLFRAKKHELRDIVRNAVMEKLIKLATEGKETELLDSYDALAEKRRNIFITRNEADYEVEGTYFQQHHPIEKKVEPTILLNSYRDQLCAVTQKLGLDQAQRDLNAIQYDKELASLLPSQVKTGRQTDSEVEVETETQTELELETELEAEEELKMNWYLPWINPIDQKHYAVHNLNKDVSDIFDLALYITENFLPLRRKEWAEKPWHRTPHDSKQNPALHLVIPITDITSKYDKPKKKKMLFGRLPKEMKEAPIKTWLEKGKPVLVDLCEVEGKTLGLENHFVYDLRLKRGISEKQVPNPNLLAWYVAQARFYDGQFQLAQYTKAEYQALLHWILEKKDPKKLEDYFVKRVLRHRPDDYEKYGYSQLRRFFILMRQLLKQPRQYLKGSPELTELKKFSEKFSLHPDVLERGLNFAPGFKGTAVEQFIKEAQV